MRDRDRRTSCVGGTGIAGGLIFITIGVIFLLDNMGVLEANAFRRWWPLLLIILGVSKLAWWRRLRDKPDVEIGPTQG